MGEILSLIGRQKSLLESDLNNNAQVLSELISDSRFLVLGGAGSIGQAVSKEIFKRNPKLLHIVDISENNLVELVRDIRSSFGYIEGEFKTFSLDIGSSEFNALIKNNSGYDYVLNLSALKHVRSEKDPYTLMRMVTTNILNTLSTIMSAKSYSAKKYFCVSTDKAANPVNLMGASKRIMELFMMRESQDINISSARFANVAFSDGSLLHGIDQRLKKNQPIVIPTGIKRYFVSPEESGQLCLMSCLLGNNREIYFPKLTENDLVSFSNIIEEYLEKKGLSIKVCKTEAEAREFKIEDNSKEWPCFYSETDTTGEKLFEEFFTEEESFDLDRYDGLGVIKSNLEYDSNSLDCFLEEITKLKQSGEWSKSEILEVFKALLPHLEHEERGKNLDQKM